MTQLKLRKLTKLEEQEAAVIFTIVLVILLGQVHSVLNDKIDNYFTNKHNIFNTFFVKKGWFWTVLLSVYFNVQYRRGLQSMLRIVLATLYWFVFTQWCFGSPIMDKLFILTGGYCEHEQHGIFSSSQCRQKKGLWKEGHDASGHVFLLSLSLILLWFELIKFRQLPAEISRFRARFRQLDDGASKAKLVLSNSIVLIVLLSGLWIWMLLITSVHFHSFTEKVSGLLFSLLGLAIYLVPRHLKSGSAAT